MAKFCSLPFLSSHLSTNKLFAIPITPSESRLISLNKRNPCFQFSCSSSGSSSVAGSHPSSSMIVFIKGLPSSTSEGSLKKSFSQFGEVSRAKIVSNKKTKQSLGSAFILFTSEESAQQAVREIGWKGMHLRWRFQSLDHAKLQRGQHHSSSDVEKKLAAFYVVNEKPSVPPLSHVELLLSRIVSYLN